MQSGPTTRETLGRREMPRVPQRPGPHDGGRRRQRDLDLRRRDETPRRPPTARSPAPIATGHLATEHPDDEKARQTGRLRGMPRGAVATASAPASTGSPSQAGNEAAATCIDCHGAHDVFPHGSERSLTHFSKLATTCGACHEQEAEDLAASVHGKPRSPPANATPRPAPTATPSTGSEASTRQRPIHRHRRGLQQVPRQREDQQPPAPARRPRARPSSTVTTASPPRAARPPPPTAPVATATT